MCPDTLTYPTPRGVVGYGVHLPRHRLLHAELGAALGTAGGDGSRVVASYDEDTTTMGVAAAREALDLSARPGALYFATTTPAYLDKTNAAAIHAALDIGHDGFAVDVAGSPRSAVGALRAAIATGGIAVLSDLRSGLPGSADERGSADAAAALLFGEPEKAVAHVIASASATAEILDQWRLPGELATRHSEERFGLSAYRPLALEAASSAVAAAGIEEPDHVVVSSPHARTMASLARHLPGRATQRPLPLGYCGAADPGVRLADVLDRARPDQTILLLVAADGCDAIVLRTTDAILRGRTSVPIAARLEGGRTVDYATYLTWRGLLQREPPRRPEPDRPAAPPAARAASWKFAFVGSACEACRQVHVPPRRVCVACGAVDQMGRMPLARATGTVATFTVDRLAYSPSPPVVDAVVDLDGGGRCTLEVTDAAPEDVDIGTRLELTFRRLYTTDGVHNYFWKARPLVSSTKDGD